MSRISTAEVFPTPEKRRDTAPYPAFREMVKKEEKPLTPVPAPDSEKKLLKKDYFKAPSAERKQIFWDILGFLKILEDNQRMGGDFDISQLDKPGKAHEKWLGSVSSAYADLKKKHPGLTTIGSILRSGKYLSEEFSAAPDQFPDLENNLKETKELIAKWSERYEAEKGKTEKKVLPKETAKKKIPAAEVSMLISDINTGNFTADRRAELADLNEEMKQELMNYASDLAKKEGMAGVDFWNKLEALGITPKKAFLPSSLAAARDRLKIDWESAGRGYTGVSGVEAAMETNTRGLDFGERPRVFSRGVIKEETEKEAEPTEPLMPKKGNAFINFFKKLFGGSKKEKEFATEQRIEAQSRRALAKKFGKYLDPFDRRRLSASMLEAETKAKFSKPELALLEKIMNGEVVSLNVEQEKTFGQIYQKAFAEERLKQAVKTAAEHVNFLIGASRLKPKARAALGKAHSSLDEGSRAAGKAGQR